MVELLRLLPRDSLSVVVIGLGGVGGIVSEYLAVFLASLDVPTRLVLVDGDTFEPRNAARMALVRIGNKAEVLRDQLRQRHPDSGLAVLAVPEFAGAANMARLVAPRDIVVLAVDNHATRRIVSQHCGTLDDVVLVSGGNDGVGPDASGTVRRGTHGNAQVYIREAGRDATPSLTRWHPEIAEPGDSAPQAGGGCVAAAASAPQLLFANLQVASCLCSAVFLQLCGALPYAEVAFDIGEGRMRPVPRPEWSRRDG